MNLIKEPPKFTQNQSLLALVAFAIIGVWFIVWGLSIRSFIGKQEIQARITSVSVNGFKRYFTYEFLHNGEIVKDETYAIISNSYNVGDEVTILFDPEKNKSYMKDLVMPNVYMNIFFALVSLGLVIWGLVHYIITMFTKKKLA